MRYFLTELSAPSCLTFRVTFLQLICYFADCGMTKPSVLSCINLPILRVHPGSSPDYSKGTYIPVFPTKQRQSSWEGRIINTSDNVVTMGITPMANQIVGKYHLSIAVATPFGIRRTRRDDSRDLYILFNPWVAGRFRVLGHNELENADLAFVSLSRP